MYAFTAHLKAKEGYAQTVKAALSALAEPSRAEPGCLVYLPHIANEQGGEFMVYERYQDEAAYETHRETEHYQRWVEGDIAPNLEARERTEYIPLEP